MSNYNFELDLNTPNTMSIMNEWINNGATVLEFGSANGRLTKHLTLQKNCRVTIVEIDEEAGQEAAQYASRSYVGTELGDINHYCWYDTSCQYDLIIFADVLEHLSDPELVLKKCRELLSPQGSILVSIPNMAHNSILIDLFNDRFYYGDTGLLDRTHVHFFTYYSFFDMIRGLNFNIISQQPVYSRVGWNEISNHYGDVPCVVEQELRHRKSGSIYQYVFRLQKAEETDNTLSFQEIVPYPEDSRTEEANCSFWPDETQPDKYDHTGTIYPENGADHCFRFPIGASIQKLRFDPMEASALLFIYDIQIKLVGNVTQKAAIADHNAFCSWKNLYYFKTPDPQMEIELPPSSQVPIEYVEIHWRILDSHLDEKNIKIYDTIFASFLEIPKQEVYNQQAISLWQNLLLKDKYQKELIEARKYEEHLLKDIQQLKSDLISLQSESSAYIAHCESDLLEQAHYINKLESDNEEQTVYITRLEKDIATQRQDITQLKGTLDEQTGYICHLENDLKILTEYARHLEADIKMLNEQIRETRKIDHV